MEPIVEEKQDELKDIDEFFGWEEGKDEDEDGLYSEFKKLVREERQNELSDHASDMIYDLKQLLSRIQTRASRYIINQQLSNHELIGSYKIFASHTADTWERHHVNKLRNVLAKQTFCSVSALKMYFRCV